MSVVLVTALATTFIQLGYFLWKLTANHSQQCDSPTGAQSFKALVTDWRWVLGTSATTIGWVLFVYATSLGDISLVQPLMSAGDFILVVLATLFLKERLSQYEWAGVILTIVGAVALAWDPRGTEPQSYSRIAFWVLVAVTIAIGLVLFLINKRSERPEVLLAPIVGLSFGLGAVLTKAMTANRLEAVKNAMDLALLLDPFLLAVVVANAVGSDSFASGLQTRPCVRNRPNTVGVGKRSYRDWGIGSFQRNNINIPMDWNSIDRNWNRTVAGLVTVVTLPARS